MGVADSNENRKKNQTTRLTTKSFSCAARRIEQSSRTVQVKLRLKQVAILGKVASIIQIYLIFA